MQLEMETLACRRKLTVTSRALDLITLVPLECLWPMFAVIHAAFVCQGMQHIQAGDGPAASLQAPNWEEQVVCYAAQDSNGHHHGRLPACAPLHVLQKARFLLLPCSVRSFACVASHCRESFVSDSCAWKPKVHASSIAASSRAEK